VVEADQGQDQSRMGKRIREVIILALLIVLIMLGVDSCKNKSKMYEQATAINNYQDTILRYSDREGELVDYNKSLKLNLKVALENVDGLKGDLKRLKLKKPKVIVKYKNTVRIDSVEVEHEIILPCDEFSYAFNVDSSNYSITGLLTDKKLSFDRISIPNNQTFIVADKREKWYKSKQYVVVVDNSNPYVVSSGLQSYTITPRKKPHEKWYTKLGAGFVLGVLFSNSIK